MQDRRSDYTQQYTQAHFCAPNRVGVHIVFCSEESNAENYIMKSLVICTPYLILFGGKIENEMGRACGAYGGGESGVET